VQGSLKQTQLLLIRQHLDACLCDLDVQDQDRAQALRDELISLFDAKIVSSQ
jgi:DNA-binding FrmR family transcriptional regulator